MHDNRKFELVLFIANLIQDGKGCQHFAKWATVKLHAQAEPEPEVKMPQSILDFLLYVKAKVQR
jgi:hypothetical protein